MTEYLIKTVFGPQEWLSDYGPRHTYSLDLEGVDKRAQLVVKPETVLKAGDKLDLTLEPHPKFENTLKAKRVQAPRPGGPSPQDTARNSRAFAQTAAVDYARFLFERGVLPKEFKLPELKRLIDWFSADARDAKP